MESPNSNYILENGIFWTGEVWTKLPEKEGKPISELAKEVKKLLESGMAAKDIIPYLTRKQERER